MRIGINAQIVGEKDAGVASRARQLITELLALPSPHEFFVFGRNAFLASLHGDGFRPRMASDAAGEGFKRVLWEQLVLPSRINKMHLDLMLYLDHTASLLVPICPSIITIHDLAFLVHPETFPRATRLYKSAGVKRSVKTADLIVTVSEATRSECELILGIPRSKLRVVHNGVGSAFRVIEDTASLSAMRQKYGLPERFILYIGTLEPRKNLVRLLEAVALLDSEYYSPTNVVLAGGKGWLYDDIFEAVKKLGLTGRVQLPGFVPQADLPYLYNLADVFVYPSMYEGFGIPPVEAMACGCPVVASDTSSLPEIIGEAGLLVDPTRTEDIARAINQLLISRDERRRFSELGLARAKQFTWQNAALQTLDVLNEFA